MFLRLLGEFMRGGDKMRQVVNFFIIGLIFWICWKTFPEYVQADNISTILVAALIFHVLWTLAEALAMAVVLAIVMSAEKNLERAIDLGALVAVGVIFFAGIGALFIAVNALPGFEVVGILPKILLTLLCSVCSVSSKPNKES